MRAEVARACGTVLVAALAGATALAQQPADVDSLLDVVSARVEQYYVRAHSIICTETVHLQPIDQAWTPVEFGRTLVYDLRVEWDRSADGETPSEPTVLRELRTVNGRPPKPKDEPGCMDPKPVSPDSLAMLLPLHRREYFFRLAGPGKVDKQPALMIDYRGRTPGPADISWKEDCVSVDLPGHYRGRVWVDPESDDVLRVDEQLVGMFEFRVPRDHVRAGAPTSMVIERADSSTRYRPVTFHDPDETLVLPASIQTFQIIRNSGAPRVRITQTFSNYRRFLTGGRLVKPGGSE